MAAQQLITIILKSGTQWRVPANWNSKSNSIKCFGAGGGGGRASPSNPCLGSPGAGGGAAGAYSEVLNQIYTPGALISYSIGGGGLGGVAQPGDGGTGGDTSIKGNDNATTVCLAKGGTGGKGQDPGNLAGSGGIGGAASSGIGSTKFSGGNGGKATDFGGGGGGGGAAGPNGPGAKGGSGAAGPGAIGGSGGGGANNGSAGTDATTNIGAPGGNGRGGTGGGAASGGSATPGLGGGGAGGDTLGGNPGNGAQDTLFRDNSGGPNNGLTAGPSGGSGASGNTTPSSVGFGGGGGGSQSDSLGNIGSPGGDGFIVIQYTPAEGPITPPSTDIWLYSGAPVASDITFHGFGSADVWLLTGLTVPSDIALITRGVLRTSYTNNGGLGDRRREIVVTSDIATSVPDGGTDWLVMINGNLTANSTNARQPSTTNDNGDRNITFDWGVNAKIIINEFRYYMSGTDTFGSWTLEGSNNGTGWTQLGSAFTFGGVAGANKVAVLNSTAYRYYRLHTTSFQGGGSSGSWLEEVEFKLLDVTLQGNRPSYYNRYGFGDRGLSSAAPITVTTDATLAGGAVQNVVDGDNSANTNAKGFTFNASQVGVNLRFDFKASVAIDTNHWYQSSAQTHGTWKLQGSPDASIWIDVGSPFTLGGAVGVNTYQMGGNLTAYRYYRIIGAPGSTSAIPVINEVEFRIFASSPSAIVITITTLSGDGFSAGVGTVTAVGAAVIPSDGSSAGVGTVTAVGAAVIPGDGSSTGAGSASAVGAAVMPSTGSSDGTSTATAASLTIIQGAGLAAATDIWLYPGAPISSDIKLYGLGAGAAGLGVATAVGVAIIPSAGSAAGVATVTAVGATVMPSTGSAAGTSTATAVGAAVMPSTGSAAGVGTATSVGVAVMPGDGSAAGVATASAVGVSVMPTVGNADGTSTATAVGADGNQVTTPVSLRLYVGWTPAADVVLRAVDSNGSQWGVGSSAGAGSAAAVGAMVMPSTGSAAGLGAAAAVGVAVVPGAGAASGSGVAAGVGVAIWSVSGAAAGSSNATAVGVRIVPAAGLAQGTSTADAFGINGAAISEPNSVSIVQLLDHSVTVLLGTGGFVLIVPDFVVNLSLPLTSQNVTVPDRSLSVNLPDRSIIVTIL